MGKPMCNQNRHLAEKQAESVEPIAKETARSCMSLSPDAIALANELLTIEEACRVVRISTRAYFKLKSQGDEPERIHLGGRVLISVEALRRWVYAHEGIWTTEDEAGEDA